MKIVNRTYSANGRRLIFVIELNTGSIVNVIEQLNRYGEPLSTSVRYARSNKKLVDADLLNDILDFVDDEEMDRSERNCGRPS